MFGTKEIWEAHMALEEHLVGSLTWESISSPGCTSCGYTFVNAAAMAELVAPNRLCVEGRDHYDKLRTLVLEYKASNGA